MKLVSKKDSRRDLLTAADLVTSSLTCPTQAQTSEVVERLTEDFPYGPFAISRHLGLLVPLLLYLSVVFHDWLLSIIIITRDITLVK